MQASAIKIYHTQEMPELLLLFPEVGLLNIPIILPEVCLKFIFVFELKEHIVLTFGKLLLGEFYALQLKKIL